MPVSPAASDAAEKTSPDRAQPAAFEVSIPGIAETPPALTSEESDELFALARKVREGAIVEFGPVRGRQAELLCAGAQAGNKARVYTMGGTPALLEGDNQPAIADRHTVVFPDLERQGLYGYAQLTNIDPMMLSRGWRMPVGMIVFDGGRGYQGLKADFDLWRSRFKPGATIVFRNARNPDLTRLLSEYARDSILWPTKEVGNLAILSFYNEKPEIYVPPAKAYKLGTIDLSENGEYVRPFREITWTVWYGGGGRYLYQPIPKCACTTIKTILLGMEGLPVAKEEWKRHNKTDNKFPGTHHLKKKESEAIFQGLTPTFKFLIVRNPYDRLVSVFADKIVSERNPYWRAQIIRSAGAQGRVIYGDISFDDFVSVISKQPIVDMDPHWRPQYYEGRLGVISWDFIGRMERMPGDLTYILERIGAPREVVARASERLNVKGSDVRLWAGVSEQTHEEFLKTFRHDFDELGYTPGIPDAAYTEVAANPQS